MTEIISNHKPPCPACRQVWPWADAYRIESGLTIVFCTGCDTRWRLCDLDKALRFADRKERQS